MADELAETFNCKRLKLISREKEKEEKAKKGGKGGRDEETIRRAPEKIDGCLIYHEGENWVEHTLHLLISDK